MRLTDLPDTIDLAFDKTALSEDERHEPFAVVSPPRRADVAEIIRLDPRRTEVGPDPETPKRGMWRGPIGSLALHMLPLLMLVSWLRTPIEIPPLIPVKLVIEQPPPQAAQPKPIVKPPPGRRASDDLGEVGPDKTERGAGIAPPTPGEPQPPATEPHPAEAAQTTPSDPPPKDQAAIESPPPAAETQVAVATPPPRPKPAPPKPQPIAPTPKLDGWILPLSPNSKEPHEARRSATFAGPNATRDEYCAHALTMTLQHIDLLPLSVLGARHGDTLVAVRVLDNGTISSVMVIKGSGYIDIDERVAQMVKAVGHFPPLPQWVQGSYADFTFHLHFPNYAER